jgi:hypothetical protein
MANVAYIVVLAILVLLIVIYYFGGLKNFISAHKESPTSSTGTTTLETTTINATSTTSLANTTITTTLMPKTCISNNSSVTIYNGNFSTGTYYGWSLSGPGFGTAPLNLTKANQNGDYYIDNWSGYGGQYAATTYHQQATSVPGNLSMNFVPVEPYLNFQIYSPKSNNLYVEVIPFRGQPVRYYYDTLQGQGTNQTGEFASASINMSAFTCQSVTFRVVSNSASDNQNIFIAVGNFYQSQSPAQTPGIAVNGT